MVEVASRDLRNNTRRVLEQVEAGEDVTITVDGRPVAVLHPVRHRSRWMPRTQFLTEVVAHRADPALRNDLAELAPDTTDDLAQLT